ncbi:site-2 protease family protein [Actinocatenispora rupis]|uniref:Zinc metalloprotease n=1 Tax=Actinocatenispora rupis TaxID=519421 RepID=A0A8J3N9H2_9ACTN|nr:site-2 protease family protein [Actinocatenispora rupis]GID11106.1 peptidase M50 [Actinocatenispora rupis]
MDDSTRSAAGGPPGVRLGRVLGIPVHVSLSWLVLAALITFRYGEVVQGNLPELAVPAAYAVGFGFVLCLMVSVFLHELGHAVTSRLHGIGVRAISLEMLGGFTEMERESPTPRVELAVSLVGPAVSAVLGLAGWGVLLVVPPGSVAHELAFQITASNLIVAVFNVLPGLPLDGGRALRALIWAATGDRYLGTRLAGYAGRVVAAATLLGCLWLYVRSPGGAGGFIVVIVGAVLAVFLWAGAGQAIRGGRLAARFDLVHAGRLARPALQVPSGTPLAEVGRRVAETGAGAVVVLDGGGTPVALVSEHAAAAVPAERAPWVTVDTVARTLVPHLVLPAALAREDVMRAVQTHPASEYLVVDGPVGARPAAAHIVGVLVADDLANLLDPKRTIR